MLHRATSTAISSSEGSARRWVHSRMGTRTDFTHTSSDYLLHCKADLTQTEWCSEERKELEVMLLLPCMTPRFCFFLHLQRTILTDPGRSFILLHHDVVFSMHHEQTCSSIEPAQSVPNWSPSSLFHDCSELAPNSLESISVHGSAVAVSRAVQRMIPDV